LVEPVRFEDIQYVVEARIACIPGWRHREFGVIGCRDVLPTNDLRIFRVSYLSQPLVYVCDHDPVHVQEILSGVVVVISVPSPSVRIYLLSACFSWRFPSKRAYLLLGGVRKLPSEVANLMPEVMM
jgi:hypothetical protein